MSVPQRETQTTKFAPEMEWRIRGYDGTRQTFSIKLPAAGLTREHIMSLLQLLTARHLTEPQTVGAALGKNDLLEVRLDVVPGERMIMMIGKNPHYVAGLFRVDETA